MVSFYKLSVLMEQAPVVPPAQPGVQQVPPRPVVPTQQQAVQPQMPPVVPTQQQAMQQPAPPAVPAQPGQPQAVQQPSTGDEEIGYDHEGNPIYTQAQWGQFSPEQQAEIASMRNKTRLHQIRNKWASFKNQLSGVGQVKSQRKGQV